ncbi:hypothetical protein XENORESO_014288 [Xenotaenia resolanae]|uniref:Uncharacterized protein n=1 Tax=Xenotaenia resolanae TaxID=208358 RepID=A0ABV0WSN7_9TELE
MTEGLLFEGGTLGVMPLVLWCHNRKKPLDFQCGSKWHRPGSDEVFRCWSRVRGVCLTCTVAGAPALISLEDVGAQTLDIKFMMDTLCCF